MSNSVQMDIHFAIPFDQTVFFEEQLLGAIRPIELQGGGRLELPCDVDSGAGPALRPPMSAPHTVTSHLPDGSWGHRAAGSPKISVEAILIVLCATTELDFDLADTQIGGDDIHKATETVSNWFDSFSHWLRVLTSQSLDPVNPDPKVIHRRSRNIVITASAGGKSSLPSSGSPGIHIVVNSEGPSSERLVNDSVLDIAVRNAGNAPSMILELLASARMAVRRGDKRRALVDAGTAVEAALTYALGLATTHSFTLGNLVTRAENQGLAIPLDTRDSLVHPRNDAVHRGSLTAPTDVNRALEVAELVASLAEPKLVPVASLTPVNRPQRHDMVIIKGPSQHSSE